MATPVLVNKIRYTSLLSFAQCTHLAASGQRAGRKDMAPKGVSERKRRVATSADPLTTILFLYLATLSTGVFSFVFSPHLVVARWGVCTVCGVITKGGDGLS